MSEPQSEGCSADLRARVIKALNSAVSAPVRDDPEFDGAPKSSWRHDRHKYHIFCALCQGEAETLADAVMAVLDRDLADTRMFEDLLGSIYLYVHWYDVTVRLTTEQKEAWADAVEAWSARLNEGEDEAPMKVPRWWRPDYVSPELETRPRPARRVTFEVTAYWPGVVGGGFYDLRTEPDGGLTFSVPEGAVDEDSIRDEEPEQLTEEDWSEIEGQVRGRLGEKRAGRLLQEWRSASFREAGGDLDG